MRNKRVLLCVTGGIAAYKAVALTSKLTQLHAKVKVIMSEHATKFVTPLTFQAISRNPVYIDTFDEIDPEKIAHIDLAEWADVIVIAPATANVIGKLAHGIADDMVTTTLLATTKPVFLAPSMNVHMYQHPSVQQNVDILASRGYRFIEPGEGYLACGYVGKGRMAEPEEIIDHLIRFFSSQKTILQGKRILITAGPTRERIDPVRFITNFSSGKMGYALAEEAIKLGAEVILVSGPVSLSPPARVKVLQVESAREMYETVLAHFPETDIIIKTAAVADYRPKSVASQKLKKKTDTLVIELEKTVDILAELGKRKQKQFLVGFAAETENIEENAKEKLRKKNLDLIVVNDVTQEGAGFGVDTNIVTIYRKNGTKLALPKMSKSRVARAILEEIATSLIKEDDNEDR